MKNLSDLKDFDGIKIYLASSEEMLAWSQGRIDKPETINYRTFKPERNGLFDERIFGPVKNFQCYCGKYKGIRYKGVTCDKCGVEVIHSRVRRERMGHILLASPVAHVWFFRGIPSKMAILLGLTPRSVESIIYFSSFIVTSLDGTNRAKALDKVTADYNNSKANVEKEVQSRVHDLETELKNLPKQDELKSQEAELKLRQQIQKVTSSFEKRFEEVERNYTLIQKKIEGIELYSVISEAEYTTFGNYLEEFCTLEIGAEAMQNVLEAMDLSALSKELRDEMNNSKGQKASKLARRLKVVEQFRRASLNPSRMIMSVIPVIPPDLRPIVQLDGGRFASSDLNELYRRLINRNNRLAKLLELGAPSIIVRNEKRMLQEAVDALFDSSKQKRKTRVTRGKKQLRSITDMIKGKQGIFRLNLLGKRVDYSGRAVIINGPKLRLHECGLPKEIALELFKPLVLREVMSRGYAPNVKSAKHYLEARSSEVWEILEELVADHPVLLNRAPTLWRLGIQAFYPKLVEGNSIRLHPCVCSGFNADFDGDQMAVHIPLSEDAIQEAKDIMLSTKNLLSPADGAPKSIPLKTMLFGTYYMTSVATNLPVHATTFASKQEILFAYDSKVLDLRQLAKVRLNGEIIETTPGRILFNAILPQGFSYVNKAVDKGAVKSLLTMAFDTLPSEEVAKLIDHIKDLGFTYGTICGQSVSLFDIQVPAQRAVLIEEGRNLVIEVNKNYRRGLITEKEVKKQIEDIWRKVIDQTKDAVWDNLAEDNPVKVLVASGSTRASKDNIRQVAGMKGLVASAAGETVQMPILGNYKSGLSALEYFVGAKGARKGLIDKGLKTADAGYLTRRLVDVAQDILVREEDCGTEHGRTVHRSDTTVLANFGDRLLGRYLAEDLVVKGKTLATRNTLIDKAMVKEFVTNEDIQKVVVRSPMNCETPRGICIKCYGTDMMTSKPINLGLAVGIPAAQAIGQPGAQLTLNVFHTGGIAAKDITQGLPRVEELVEARTPKFLAVMSELDGKVLISQSGDERKITVVSEDPNVDVKSVEYMIDALSEIIVRDGDLVQKGDRLTSGNLDLSDLFSIAGADKARRYVLEEIQKVYASQGELINDKHLEVIISKMFNHVVIEDAGDTTYMAAELATKSAFKEENDRVMAEGGQPATAKLTLLGITKAALNTDSFLAAASFIQTSNVLTEAAASGKVDSLYGLKENVIIGKLIPTGVEAVSKS